MSFERDVNELGYDCPSPLTIEQAASVSIAISLKRIADALDYGDDDTNLVEIIGGIEMNTRKT